MSGIFITKLVLQFKDYETGSGTSSKIATSKRLSLEPVDPIEDLLNVAALYDGNGYQTEGRTTEELESQLLKRPEVVLNMFRVLELKHLAKSELPCYNSHQ
ncbi:unnamed protein product [Allacma fusca]|uniref:Uncharacterized protein n=1 Tax=Allacma fusca TaxID=39272 RepID=A0A8J2KQT3_9HEXA|nr:unnamed protein product [Allacma fusca]